MASLWSILLLLALPSVLVTPSHAFAPGGVDFYGYQDHRNSAVYQVISDALQSHGIELWYINGTSGWLTGPGRRKILRLIYLLPCLRSHFIYLFLFEYEDTILPLIEVSPHWTIPEISFHPAWYWPGVLLAPHFQLLPYVFPLFITNALLAVVLLYSLVTVAVHDFIWVISLLRIRSMGEMMQELDWTARECAVRCAIFTFLPDPLQDLLFYLSLAWDGLLLMAQALTPIVVILGYFFWWKSAPSEVQERYADWGYRVARRWAGMRTGHLPEIECDITEMHRRLRPPKWESKSRMVIYNLIRRPLAHVHGGRFITSVLDVEGWNDAAQPAGDQEKWEKQLGSSEDESSSETRKKHGRCVICLHRRAEVVLVPCGHMILCRECYGQIRLEAPEMLSTCLLCKSLMRTACRVYTT
ncbi:hypothetical protein FOZ63_021491 [Perkinsus olseni]|uniref:RING-type domain-containing protein n=2 Tax=Perkinsus olseni TaxID=32597 RepID=A0A7J6QLA0_PEROL|nr:hypothetical protein FOZ63_021491 [Perkinsus olseni]